MHSVFPMKYVHTLKCRPYVFPILQVEAKDIVYIVYSISVYSLSVFLCHIPGLSWKIEISPILIFFFCALHWSGSNMGFFWFSGINTKSLQYKTDINLHNLPIISTCVGTVDQMTGLRQLSEMDPDNGWFTHEFFLLRSFWFHVEQILPSQNQWSPNRIDRALQAKRESERNGGESAGRKWKSKSDEKMWEISVKLATLSEQFALGFAGIVTSVADSGKPPLALPLSSLSTCWANANCTSSADLD